MTPTWREKFDKAFVTENLWKSDDELTANVPIDNIKLFISEVEAEAYQVGYNKGYKDAKSTNRE